MPNEKPEVSLQDELQSLRSDLSNIKSDLQSLADSAVNRVKHEARGARDRSRAKLESSLGSIEDYVEGQPITSIMVAFAVGLVLGKVMSFK